MVVDLHAGSLLMRKYLQDYPVFWVRVQSCMPGAQPLPHLPWTVISLGQNQLTPAPRSWERASNCRGGSRLPTHQGCPLHSSSRGPLPSWPYAPKVKPRKCPPRNVSFHPFFCLLGFGSKWLASQERHHCIQGL